MDHFLERYTLRPVRSPQEWSVYHAIRRDAIFSALLPGQAYDERDPDEFQHRHLPHALVRDGEIIGTVRIDLVGEAQAGLRLIAIRRDLQRQGHGRVLLRLAEHAARGLGRTEIIINATRRRSPSISPMAIARVNGATPGRCRRTSFGWESDCPSRTRIADSRGCGRVPREPAALCLRPQASIGTAVTLTH